MKRLLLILLLAGCGSERGDKILRDIAWRNEVAMFNANNPDRRCNLDGSEIPHDSLTGILYESDPIRAQGYLADSLSGNQYFTLSADAEVIFIIEGDTLSSEEVDNRLLRSDSSAFWKAKFDSVQAMRAEEARLIEEFYYTYSPIAGYKDRIAELERELQTAAAELTILRGHKCDSLKTHCQCPWCHPEMIPQPKWEDFQLPAIIDPMPPLPKPIEKQEIYP